MANYHIGRLTMDCILAGRDPRTTKITYPAQSPTKSVDPCRQRDFKNSFTSKTLSIRFINPSSLLLLLTMMMTHYQVKILLTATSHFDHFLSNDHFYNRKFSICILTSYRSWVRIWPFTHFYFKCITIYLGAKWIWALSAMLKLKFRKSKLKMKLIH